jgi:hypothetical protein
VLEAWSENTSYTKQNKLKSAMIARRGVKIGSLAMLLFAAQPANALEWEPITDDYSNARMEVPDQKPVQESNSMDAVPNEGGGSTLKSGRTNLGDEQDIDLLEGSTFEGGKPERTTEDNTYKQSVGSINLESMSEARKANRSEESMSMEDTVGTVNTKYKSTESGSQPYTTSGSTREWELVPDNQDETLGKDIHSIASIGLKWEYVPLGQEIKIGDMVSAIKQNGAQKEGTKTTGGVSFDGPRENWFTRLIKRKKATAAHSIASDSKIADFKALSKNDIVSTDNSVQLGNNIIRYSGNNGELIDENLLLEETGMLNTSEQMDNNKEPRIRISPYSLLGVNDWKTPRIGSSFQLVRIRF